MRKGAILSTKPKIRPKTYYPKNSPTGSTSKQRDKNDNNRIIQKNLLADLIISKLIKYFSLENVKKSLEFFIKNENSKKFKEDEDDLFLSIKSLKKNIGIAYIQNYLNSIDYPNNSLNAKITNIIYRNKPNENFYYLSLIEIKKNNIAKMRCHDKSCNARADYNIVTKELDIYAEHSKNFDKHLYLSESCKEWTSGNVNYMKKHPEIIAIEIIKKDKKYPDEINIVNNIKINYKTKIENIENKNHNESLNSKKQKENENDISKNINNFTVKDKIKIESEKKEIKEVDTKIKTEIKNVVKIKKPMFIVTKVNNFQEQQILNKKTKRKKEKENVVEISSDSDEIDIGDYDSSNNVEEIISLLPTRRGRSCDRLFQTTETSKKPKFNVHK